MSFNLKVLGHVGDAIMVRHTLFSLPWALGAVLLVTQGKPDPMVLFWVILAAVGARTAANAANRLIDADWDAANPRTAQRELPSGKVSSQHLIIATVASASVMILAVIQLNFLCLLLLPAAGAMIFWYSYTKRFTWLCHFWLGATCALAPLGAFLAFAGHFEARFLVLWGTVAFWVAGFDILYAVQDIEFDRTAGLKSLPARFGAKTAYWSSLICHGATLAGLALTGFLWPIGPWYWGAVAVTAGLLLAEQLVARGGTERHFKIASYSINELVGVSALVFIALGVYGGPPGPGLEALGLKGWSNWFSLDMFSMDFLTLKGIL